MNRSCDKYGFWFKFPSTLYELRRTGKAGAKFEPEECYSISRI